MALSRLKSKGLRPPRFKGGLSPKGRRMMTRQQIPIQARKLKAPAPASEPPPVVIDGIVLNRLASKVYRALVDLAIPFVPEWHFGGGIELGGGSIDFALTVHHVALEVQGEEFHKDLQKEFDRLVNRQFAGWRRVELWPWEVEGPNLHQIILRKVGR